MPDQPAKIWAIVPAAGTGQRMGERVPKQYLELNDKTVLEHSVGVLSECSDIEQVLLCTAADDARWSALGLNVTQTVGGDSRAESVRNGLNALADLADSNDWVLVHDAARPCLSSKTLKRFIDQARAHDVGGVLAMRAKDTLKQSSAGNSEIASTIDRANVWQAQTPQMFRYQILSAAIDTALKDGAVITDESSAMEHSGYKPLLIESDAKNLKITTPEDLTLAEFLLRSAPEIDL